MLSVKFPAYIIESGQVKTDPEKIQAVVERPMLTTRKQQFLAFASLYRQFIRNYNRVAVPFTKFTSL